MFVAVDRNLVFGGTTSNPETGQLSDMPSAWSCLYATVVFSSALSSAVAQAATADYVVVGGGTAGCVLASKLCQGLPDAKIVLLERANPRSAEAEATVQAMRNFFNPVVGATPEVTEAWESEPNPGLAENKTVKIFTGTTLGGSSAVNGAQFSTPTNQVAADWGVTGLDEATAGALYQRVRDTLGVDQPPPALTTSYHQEYFEANAALGVRVIEKPDIPDGADVDAVWTSYLAADEIGRRMDSNRGYLEPVRATCANLEVIEGGTVTKLLLEGNSTVTGVQYKLGTEGAAEEISVTQELLLSAGPYHTPKLLQLSGIGPSAMLESFNVPVAADLPVGQSAQARTYDNILSSYTGKPLSQGGSYDEAADRENATALFEEGQPSLMGFTRAQLNGIWAPPLGIWRVMSFIFDGGFADPRVHQAGCIPNPESFATLSLRSTDPFDTPVVDTNLFGAPGEAETMIECLNKEREVIAQMPPDFNFTELPRFPETITPEDVQETVVNGNHFVGTCGIGRVLDADLKVIGFSNLRVVDASAIPEMPANSGPAGSVYMLAEHISDLIIATGGGSGPESTAAQAPGGPSGPESDSSTANGTAAPAGTAQSSAAGTAEDRSVAPAAATASCFAVPPPVTFLLAAAIALTMLQLNV